MKNLVLCLAVALFALAVPVSADEICTANPATTLAAPTAGAEAPIDLIILPPPRCFEVSGQACSPAGATRSCTDACNNRLTCTCVNVGAFPHVTLRWRCQVEC